MTVALYLKVKKRWTFFWKVECFSHTNYSSSQQRVTTNNSCWSSSCITTSNWSFFWLEKHWITQDGYFRLITTLFGIIVTDSWISYKFHMHPNHRHKIIGIKDYICILCEDFLQNSEDATAISNGAFLLMDNATTTETNSVTSLINLDD